MRPDRTPDRSDSDPDGSTLCPNFYLKNLLMLFNLRVRKKIVLFHSLKCWEYNFTLGKFTHLFL